MSCESDHFLLLVYPTSSIGHYLNQISKDEISDFSHLMVEQLKKSAIEFVNETSNFERTINAIRSILDNFHCECEKENHYDDDRIKTAINYLEQNFERIIPVEEIAQKCFLSPSRFLHLFKEKTGITYRRVQQWNKVSQSYQKLFSQNITETAHEFGFTDSAHYTKVFKETFGFNPKDVQKFS